MHIVVFTGGEFTKPEDSKFFFKNVEKPSFIIAADSGLVAALEYSSYNADFSPDIILGDMDSLKDAPSLLKKFPAEKIIRHNPYKDFTDTELALDYAHKKIRECDAGGKKFITLVGGCGGRADHFLGIFDLFSVKSRPDAWLCGNQVHHLVHIAAGFLYSLDIRMLCQAEHCGVVDVLSCPSRDVVYNHWNIN